MACFTKLRKEVVENKTTEPAMMPEDFVDSYYSALLMRGINIGKRVPKFQMTDAFICGATQEDYYNGCEIPGTDIIQLDKSLYMKATNAGRKCLVFHEMSHKYLMLPHREGPAIMQPSTLQDNYFLANYEKLMDQLANDYKRKMGQA